MGISGCHQRQMAGIFYSGAIACQEGFFSVDAHFPADHLDPYPSFVGNVMIDDTALFQSGGINVGVLVNRDGIVAGRFAGDQDQTVLIDIRKRCLGIFRTDISFIGHDPYLQKMDFFIR